MMAISTTPRVTGIGARAPTRQVFITGTAATYTRPGDATVLVVRMKGGGGGGGGSGDTAPSAATAGGTTIFNSINANGGALGGTGTFSSSTGGTGGTGTASFRIAGAPGMAPTLCAVSATNAQYAGGAGGGDGGGTGNLGGAGGAAATNSGGGGGGGGLGSQTWANLNAHYTGSGGAEGEYVEIIITNPAPTYVYTVGAAGTAGPATANGFAGGDGAIGLIIVDEY